MSIAATAISSLLLSLGLATCGWRFFETFKNSSGETSEKSIGRLLMSLFFLSAAYNAVSGISSLLLIGNATTLLWLTVASHILLTALAFLSVYTVYYIFSPEHIPRALLTTISAMGGIGLFHINTPLQLAPLLIENFSAGLLVITASLLAVSAGSMLFLFVQLFRRAEDRSIKILSAAVCGLTLASAANIAIQIGAPYWQFNGTGLVVIEIILGLIGAGFLVSMITTPALRWSTIILGIFLIWWTLLYIKFNGDSNPISTTVWSDVYNLMAVWGVWWGFRATQRLGGIKTLFGKAMTFLTLGLLLQSFGQITFSIYFNLFGIEVPYPSLADIAYLGSPILYLIGLATFSRALGMTQNINEKHRSAILLTSLGILIFSGFAIGLGTAYTFDWSEPLRIVLDFAYPLVESLCLILIFIILLNKTPCSQLNRTFVTVGAALFMQYSADMLFTYLEANDLWHNGSPGELPYLIAYFLMTNALIQFKQLPIKNLIAVAPINRTKRAAYQIGISLKNTESLGSFAEISKALTLLRHIQFAPGNNSDWRTKKTNHHPLSSRK